MRRKRDSRDFDAEIQSHLAHETETLLNEGVPPADAANVARRAFGNVTLARERFYESVHWVWFDQLRQDLRYAIRVLCKSPLFASVAVVSLALGIGANVALFNIVHKLLLQALPYRDAERLVYVTEFWPHEPIMPGPPSPDFANWRAKSKLADGIAAYGGGADALNLTSRGEPERLQGTMVTANLLELLGTRMALGRNFTADEDRPGGPAAVILGYRLWQSKFEASPYVIGKTIRLNGIPRTIVGVLPSGFVFPDNNFRDQLLVPMALAADQHWHDDLNFRLLRVLAKLKPEVAPAALKDEFSAILRSTAQEEPPQMVTMRKDMEVRMTPLRDWLTGGVRQMILILQATVGLLLAIACLNIAGLQAARATNRQREMCLRAAVGAGRTRLLKQLLTESVLLGLLGGALGVGLAFWSMAWLRAFLPANLHLVDGIRMNGPVLMFAVGTAVFAAILSGLAPAMAASRTHLHDAMKEGQSPGQGKQRLQAALVIAEIAMTMVLLAGSGLFIKRFVQLASADPGFRPEGVLTMRVALPANSYGNDRSRIGFYTRLVERARTIPGVSSAAVAGGLPVIGARSRGGLSIQGEPDVPAGGRPTITIAGITSDYFQTLGIPILRGRGFALADESGPQVAIVNEAFAAKFFPGQDALGKRIEVGSREGQWREIVGIAGTVKQQERRPPDPYMIYSPLRYFVEPEAFLVLKSPGMPPEQLTTAAVAAVHAIDPDLPLYDVASMRERLGSAIAAPRASMTLMAIFAGLGLILSMAGVFGVTSYLVNRRRREIGIRIALGATKGRVARMVLGRGLRLAGVGIAIGVGASMGFNRALGSVIEGIQTDDWATLSAAAGAFALATAAACVFPARRAAKADPMTALRSE
ncbi:MAG: ABC transporter permease [Bryobacterales bacterium]|nr:ABC transporter permease [Bryobacterales bacterium]MBV9400432.1 ABC transporter permease [Bryobacterales bacterium]